MKIPHVKLFLSCNFSRVLFIRAARVRAFFRGISSDYAVPSATLWRVALCETLHAARESFLRAVVFRSFFFFSAHYLRSVRSHFPHKVFCLKGAESRGCKSFVEICDKYHYLVTIVMQSRTFKRKRCCIFL